MRNLIKPFSYNYTGDYMKKFRFVLLVLLLVLIIIVLIIAGCGLFVHNEKVSSASLTKDFVVVLDCGHGGADGGAVGADGTAEKNINLALGFKFREILEENGYPVVMTRDKDDFICDDHSASLREQNISDLHNRLKIAESYKNSVFISLHMNKYQEHQYWGSQVFYGPKNSESKLLAQCIRKSLINSVQKGNERQLKKMDSNVYIIYNATNPAILLECGFMSNPQELNRFKNEKYQSKFVYNLYLGLVDYLNTEKQKEV